MSACAHVGEADRASRAHRARDRASNQSASSLMAIRRSPSSTSRPERPPNIASSAVAQARRESARRPTCLHAKLNRRRRHIDGCAIAPIDRAASLARTRASSKASAAATMRSHQRHLLRALALFARRARRRAIFRRRLVEQFGELLRHHAAQLLGVDDRDGALVIARHVVADADGDQLDRRARLDPAGSRRANGVRDNCRDSPTAWNRRPARRRKSPSGCGAARGAPIKRSCAHINASPSMFSFSKPFAHHQAEIAPRAPPRRIRALVDDVAQIVEPARLRRTARLQPILLRRCRPSRRAS